MPEYSPPADLADFLASGSNPIYIGFGSIVIDDPAGLTKTLLEAVRACGVRAIISRGWSKIGEASGNESIFYLDDCPHEWLFQNVRAVIHHGGAGTTACGLLNARPTLVVPFFGVSRAFQQSLSSSRLAGYLQLVMRASDIIVFALVYELFAMERACDINEHSLLLVNRDQR